MSLSALLLMRSGIIQAVEWPILPTQVLCDSFVADAFWCQLSCDTEIFTCTDSHLSIHMPVSHTFLTWIFQHFFFKAANQPSRPFATDYEIVGILLSGHFFTCTKWLTRWTAQSSTYWKSFLKTLSLLHLCLQGHNWVRFSVAVINFWFILISQVSLSRYQVWTSPFSIS